MAVSATSLYWADDNIGGVLKVDKNCGSTVTVGDVVDAGAFDGEASGAPRRRATR